MSDERDDAVDQVDDGPRRLDDRLVLVVDDDPDIRSAIELTLGAEGAEIVSAEDGDEAVTEFLRERPDLIVLDMMLPRRSGFLVLERIQESDDPPPVIMVTANQGHRHAAYARTLGVSAYMLKPVPLERLIDTAVDLLAEADAADAED